jgi:hypothetical protein
MARRHENHEAVNLASLYSLQLFRNALVMAGALILRVRELSERE